MRGHNPTNTIRALTAKGCMDVLGALPPNVFTFRDVEFSKKGHVVAMLRNLGLIERIGWRTVHTKNGYEYLRTWKTTELYYRTKEKAGWSKA